MRTARSAVASAAQKAAARRRRRARPACTTTAPASTPRCSRARTPPAGRRTATSAQDHPVQQALPRRGRASGPACRRPTIGSAVDGCGVVVFALPLEPMARAYARLADAARRSAEIPVAHRARDADAPVPRRRHRPLRLGADRGDRGARASPRSAPRACTRVAHARRGHRRRGQGRGWRAARAVPGRRSGAAAARRAAGDAAAATRRVPARDRCATRAARSSARYARSPRR